MTEKPATLWRAAQCHWRSFAAIWVAPVAMLVAMGVRERWPPWPELVAPRFGIRRVELPSFLRSLARGTNFLLAPVCVGNGDSVLNRGGCDEFARAV
jgi:hypothetical protein